MNGKLIFALSLFGLAMAFATVFFIPSRLEIWIWLAIFLISAYAIGRGASRNLFLHGLLLGILNSVWVTVVHVALYDAYMAHHPKEAAMMQSNPMPLPPRLLMACVGPLVGVFTGVIIGLLAMLAGRMNRPKAQTPTAA